MQYLVSPSPAPIEPRWTSELVLHAEVEAIPAHVYVPALVALGRVPISDVHGPFGDANRQKSEHTAGNAEARRYRNFHVHPALKGRRPQPLLPILKRFVVFCPVREMRRHTDKGIHRPVPGENTEA